MKYKFILSAIFVALIIYFDNTANAQGVSINSAGNPPDQSAVFDVSATNKGMLIPRLTTAQRNAISNPAAGLLIFNTTTNCFEFYVYNTWQTGMCAVCPTVAAPTTATHSPGQTQITWDWNTVSGAIGYKWNTTNIYGTATDVGTSTSYTQTGLFCNTTYTLYVWAYNVCGNSTAATLTQSTAACPFACGSSVTFTYRGSSVTYGTVSHIGKCWLDRNLGASQVATSSTDANAYGDLFQWGRLDDGHQSRTSGTTTVLSSNDNPGHSNFIYPPNADPKDWRSPPNDNLWNGIGGINNPCPSGWRIPTATDWDTERQNWSSNDYAGAFASPLKLTMAGFRYTENGTGSLQTVGGTGFYWSVPSAPPYATALYFHSSAGVPIGNYYRAYGMSVRCIHD